MTVAITGASGQLGTDLAKVFSDQEVMLWVRSDFDVCHHQRATEAILSARPSVLINTAAFHKTDACEDNPELAFAVNSIAVRNLALACQSVGSTFVQISTDYVFDGSKRDPYTEMDCPSPINVYGASKLAGERFVAATCSRYYIVRVAGLFGSGGVGGKGANFVETMLARARRGEALTVVDDVTMSPTSAADAARAIRMLVEADVPSGVYHVTNTGACSWFSFAAEILRQTGLSADLRPTTIAALSPRAPRPRYSVLGSVRLPASGLPRLRTWQEALSEYLNASAVGAHT